MLTLKKALAVTTAIAAMIILACTEESNNGDYSLDPTPTSGSVVFKNIQSSLQVPSQVQFTFRVTDRDNHAVIIDDRDLQSSFHIFEDGEEIDYRETSYFVTDAANLELDMILLLDFTNSMATWSDSGVTAIDLMVSWARELIDDLPLGHRMALMEYHDRNLNAELIAPFSSNVDALHQALDDFLIRQIDHGSSRNWDALASAIDQFDGQPEDGRQRLVVAITDGRETSSEKTPAEIIEAAQEWNAGVFIIGTGAVSNEAVMRSVAEQTGGEYYAAGNINAFSEELVQIRRDLGGQYRVSYITLRTAGIYNVRVELDYEDHEGAFEQVLDLGSIYGDDRIGEITIDELVLQDALLDVRFRARHVPRNIDRFRFKLVSPRTYSLSLPAAEDGGLCSDWQVSGPGLDGWIEISSSEALAFGAFGLLWRLQITDVTEEDEYFEFSLDTTIYRGGKTFTYPRYIVVGNPDFAVYDFETGDIPPIFVNRSAQPWELADSNVFQGSFAISCGPLAAAGGSSISVELDVGFADTISFALAAANSQHSVDAGLFEFYIDSDRVFSSLGELPWTQIVSGTEPGTHKFTWRLLVGEADLTAKPRIWIDNIVLK
jgi:hypothetical protein